ncbi:MAG: hypothetical protein HQ581_27620 [Planctomycetes bacterium]|nr:hypothetical protein [Planctomycetota bacterium]
MADLGDGFNGATLTWDPAGAGVADEIGPLTNISEDITGAEVDVSGSPDATKNYEAGIADYTVSCDVKGCPAVVTIGAEGDAVTVAWPDDGTEGTLADACFCSSISVSGRLDGPIESSLSFKRKGQSTS